MKAYSLDLRRRIVAAVERGVPRAEVATLFAVSPSTVKRLLARRRNPADDLAATPPPGRRRTIPLDQHTALWSQLEAQPDMTIAQHTVLWNATYGTGLSQWTVGRAIRRLGWTRKKRRWVSPSGMSQLALTIVPESPPDLLPIS